VRAWRGSKTSLTCHSFLNSDFLLVPVFTSLTVLRRVRFSKHQRRRFSPRILAFPLPPLEGDSFPISCSSAGTTAAFK